MRSSFKPYLFLIVIVFLTACASQNSTDPPIQKTKEEFPTVSPFTATALSTPSIFVEATRINRPVTLRTPSPVSSPTPQSSFVKVASFGKGNISPVFRSPNGKILITGRIDGMARWYDTRTGRELGSVDADILEAVFSPDSRMVALKTYFGLMVVNLETGKILVDLQDSPIAYRNIPVFSQDLQFIALHNGVRTSRAVYEHIEMIRLAGNGDPEILPILNEDEERFMSAPAISPDSTLVAAGCSDKRVYVWNAESGKIRFALEGHTDDIRGVAFSLDRSMLVSSGVDGTLRVWDPYNGKQVRVFTGFSSGFPQVTFTPDNRVKLGAANEPNDLLIDPITGNRTTTVPRTTNTFDPFERNLHRLGYLTDEWGSSNPVQFHPDGRTIAIGGRNILLWDIKTQQVLKSFEVMGGRRVNRLVFSPDGKWMAASLLNNGLQVWDVRTGQSIFEQAADPKIDIHGVYTPAFSPDSKKIAFGIGRRMQIWDLNSQIMEKSLNLPEKDHFASQVAFSKDGRKLYAVINWNMGGQVWDLASSTLVANIGFEYDRQGNFSASDLNPPFFARNNSDQTSYWIEIWNMDTGQVKKLPVGDSFNEPLIFSPDASLVAIIRNSQQLFLWDRETGDLRLRRHLENWADAAINASNNLLAMGHNGIVDLYELSPVSNR